MRVLGVDPGGTTTGFYLFTDVENGDAGQWLLVHRTGSRLEYVESVLDTVNELTAMSPVMVCVEDVTHPNPHAGTINVDGIIGAAQILGVVCATGMRQRVPVIVIPPMGHGSGPRQAYPPELWPDREPKGTGKMRHVRSAFDIGQAGWRLRRQLEGRNII